MRNQETWQEIRKHLHQEVPPAPARKRRKKVATANPTSWQIFKSAISEIKQVVLVVAFFSLVINVLMLVSPIFSMQVYDRVLSSGSMPTLLYLGLAAIVLMLVSAILEGVRSRVLVRLGGRFDELLSGTLFSALVEQQTHGEKSGSLNDLDTLRNFLTGSGLFFFFDAPWIPIFLVVMFMLHPLFFAIALGGAVMLFMMAVASEVATRRTLGEAAKHFNNARHFAGEVTSKVDTVEAMGMGPGLLERWQDRYQSGLAAQAKASDYGGVLTSMTKFIRPTLQVAIMGMGAYLVINQQISAGGMIASSIIMGRALAPVEGAIGNWRNFIMARAAYGRIKSVMKASKQQTAKMSLPEPLGNVSVDQLEGAPPNCQENIIKGVSFALNRGEALGIVGPSASGKSTLARLLVGVWHGSSGHVRIDGADVHDWDRSQLGPHIGYLAQSVDLFDGTVAENIARFGEEDADAIVAAAQEAGVHEMILRLPAGYNTEIGPNGMVLSGGQRQRIGLARAIYGNPTLVVLDEPYSNLDEQGERALKATLANLKYRGTTVVMIAHRPSLLDKADKILVLRDGKADKFGPADEVMQSLYRAVRRPAPAARPAVAQSNVQQAFVPPSKAVNQ